MMLPDLGGVAFIGLGNMGTPMSRRLIGAGYPVVGYDLSDVARHQLAEAGGQVAESAAAAVEGARVVILMLPNSDIVEAVLSEPALLEALVANSPLLVDMSSSEPLRTRALAAVLAERGLTLIDAPVSGGVSGATAGTLMIMVGGSDEDVASVAPVLVALGNPVHAGAVGSGHAAKALNNLLSATHLWITTEAVLAGERFGIEPAVLLSIFNGSSGRSGSTENKWPNFILGETYNSGFGLRLMLKDIKIAVELTKQMGMPTQLGVDAVDLWSRVAAQYPADADHTEVARWLRESNGRSAMAG
jgi:3-hydroxyisobutyrate dehydrogenase